MLIKLQSCVHVDRHSDRCLHNSAAEFEGAEESYWTYSNEALIKFPAVHLSGPVWLILNVNLMLHGETTALDTYTKHVSLLPINARCLMKWGCTSRLIMIHYFAQIIVILEITFYISYFFLNSLRYENFFQRLNYWNFLYKLQFCLFSCKRVFIRVFICGLDCHSHGTHLLTYLVITPKISFTMIISTYS